MRPDVDKLGHLAIHIRQGTPEAWRPRDKSVPRIVLEPAGPFRPITCCKAVGDTLLLHRQNVLRVRDVAELNEGAEGGGGGLVLGGLLGPASGEGLLTCTLSKILYFL